MALNIHVQIFSGGNAWLVAHGKHLLHTLYAQGFRSYQKKFEGSAYTMEVWLFHDWGRIRIWGKGEIGFEFFTTGKPVFFDDTVAPPFDLLKNIAVRTTASLQNGTIKFKSAFGNTERSIYGSDSSIFPGREAQMQLASQPLIYLPTYENIGGRRVYSEYVSESYAPMHSHTGIAYRAATWGGLAGAAAISTAYQHSARDYFWDNPFIYGSGLNQQNALYHDDFDWPRGSMKRTVKQEVMVDGNSVEITRTFGIVVDVSHKIHVFPLDQCDPSKFTTWPVDPGTGGIPDAHHKEATYTWPAWVWNGELGGQRVRDYADTQASPEELAVNAMVDYPEYAIEFSPDGKKCCAVVYSRGPKLEYDSAYFDYLHNQSANAPYSSIGYEWLQDVNFEGGGWNHYHATGTVSNLYGYSINGSTLYGHHNPGYKDELYHWATGIVEITIDITLAPGDFSSPDSWNVTATANTIIDPSTHTGGAPIAAGYVWYDTVPKEKGKPGDLIWLECAIWYKESEARKKYDACYVANPQPPADPYDWPRAMRGCEHLRTVYNVHNYETGKHVLSLGGNGDIDYSFFDWDMKSMSFVVWARTQGEVQRFPIDRNVNGFETPVSMKGRQMAWAVIPIVLGIEQQHTTPTTQPAMLTTYIADNAVPSYDVAGYLLGEGWEQIPLSFGINGWDDFNGNRSDERLWLVAHNTNPWVMYSLPPLSNLKLKYAHSFGEDWGSTWPDFYLGMATEIRPGWHLYMEQLTLRTLLNMTSTQSFSVHPSGSFSLFIDCIDYWAGNELPEINYAAVDNEIFMYTPHSVAVYKLADHYVDKTAETLPETVIVDRIYVRYVDSKGVEVGAGVTSYRDCYNRAVIALNQEPNAPEPFDKITIDSITPELTVEKRKMDDYLGSEFPFKLMYSITPKDDGSYTGNLSTWSFLYQEHNGQSSTPLVTQNRLFPLSFRTKQHWLSYDFGNNDAQPYPFPILDKADYVKDFRVDGCWFYGG
jgi:hypothetical protein